VDIDRRWTSMTTYSEGVRDSTVDTAADTDLVPHPWKGLFNNEEWLMHRIVVYSTYGFLAIAILAHILVYLWRPWLP
jgi:light-harvesting complex 1 beta chain